MFPEKNTVLLNFVKNLKPLRNFRESNLTFQPVINTRSKLINSAKAHDDGFNNCFDRLNPNQQQYITGETRETEEEHSDRSVLHSEA